MRKKYKLIDMIEAEVIDIGTFNELALNNNIDINKIKWSYYQDVMINKRYLVKEETR